ncbi:SMAD mothers against DPP 4 [Fasciola gigantica]|uniref:SMAD mothers against DPP 4 n=1 Tax=Fasciola gigantica TaxID=46835 RepID=A0A504YGD7_FASGI|nr:SMAD mothers against DPP 4 [Fasciola gigantica]
MQTIRLTENKIEKVLLKQSEATHIGQTYSAIHNKLKEESITYLTTVDALKVEIERCTRKLNELRPIYEDALLIRDKTKTELQRHEELFYAHRKRRELEIGSMRRLVEAKREKPVPQKMPMFEQELRKLDVEVIGEEMEEETASEPQNRLDYYALVHDQLKTVTGISDLKEIVARIEGQQETYAQLDEIRQQNDHELKQLKMKRKKLREELSRTRTNFEDTKMRQEELQKEQTKLSDQMRNRLFETQSELKRVQSLESRVRVTIEHLHNKLMMVRIASKRERAQSASAVRDLVMGLSTHELLERCLELHTQLETDLEDYDLAEENFRMTDALSECLRTRDEYRPTVERRLPSYAARIGGAAKEPPAAEDNESSENEVPTREALKQRSKLIVEHAKRKVLRGGRRRS